MRFIQIVLHYNTTGMHSHRSSSESATRPNWSRGARGAQGIIGIINHAHIAYFVLHILTLDTSAVSISDILSIYQTLSHATPSGAWSSCLLAGLGWINYYGNHRWLLFKLRRCLPAYSREMFFGAKKESKKKADRNNNTAGDIFIGNFFFFFLWFLCAWPRCWRSFSTWRAGSQPYSIPQLKCECVNKIVKLQFDVAILFFSLRFLSVFWNGQLHWQKLFTRTLRSAAFGGVQTCRLRPSPRNSSRYWLPFNYVGVVDTMDCRV